MDTSSPWPPRQALMLRTSQESPSLQYTHDHFEEQIQLGGRRVLLWCAIIAKSLWTYVSPFFAPRKHVLTERRERPHQIARLAASSLVHSPATTVVSTKLIGKINPVVQVILDRTGEFNHRENTELR